MGSSAEKKAGRPAIVVFSTLFPHEGEPRAGLFIRERMFPVAKRLPLTVVSPRPWFPLQSLIRRFKPLFRREGGQKKEQQGDVEVWLPHFFCLPGVLKFTDGLFMALGAYSRLKRLKRDGRLDVIDSHFAYPDGFAAVLLGKMLKVPVTITMRGTEPRMSKYPIQGRLVRYAIRNADWIICVSGALRNLAIECGASPERAQVVGNGINLKTFYPLERQAAREQWEIPQDVPVLVSVGGLQELKGFHRVMEVLPSLRKEFPGLQYLAVGEGEWREKLHQLRDELDLQDCVRFLGALPPTELKGPLSASNLFVLATRREGWANVFLEAMAIGLPVVATRVGGNPEVVCKPELGTLVEFGDAEALEKAIAEALRKDWDHQAIKDYAAANTWDHRVDVLVDRFSRLVEEKTS